jgi:hypothetical protein
MVNLFSDIRRRLFNLYLNSAKEQLNGGLTINEGIFKTIFHLYPNNIFDYMTPAFTAFLFVYMDEAIFTG